jgi:hypothetical protein
VTGSQIIIDHKATLGEPNTKVFCAKFDYEDKYIAAGFPNSIGNYGLK